jgi:acyl-CoA dehydrogenase
MYQWSEEQEMVRTMVRDFIDKEVRPVREDLEFGDLPPYDLLRKMFATFGMSDMQRESFRKTIEREKAVAAGEEVAEKVRGPRDPNSIAFTMIPIIELCRVCPGMVTAMGVSMGLTAAAIMSKGTTEQKER